MWEILPDKKYIFLLVTLVINISSITKNSVKRKVRIPWQ